jgi:hypothetical protein
MKENTVLNSMKNVNYKMDAFGRTLFHDPKLMKAMDLADGADPFQDLLWNGGCANQSC